MTLSGQLMAASVDGSSSQFVVKDVKPLFPVNLFTGPNLSWGYDVAADGRRFLLNSAGEAQQPRVVLITNWTAALQK